MATKPTKSETGEVVPLFGRARIDDEPGIRGKVAPISSRPQVAPVSVETIDLTGKPKCWFLVGPGGSGKTLLARYLGWRMAEEGRKALIAALDRSGREPGYPGRRVGPGNFTPSLSQIRT